MGLFNKLNFKNHTLAVVIAIALLMYLYLDTPVPAKLMLNKNLVVVAALLILFCSYHLMKKTNILVAILFALVGLDVIRKSLIPDLNDISKKITYYDNLEPVAAADVISDKLKNSNTLEQDIVQNMNLASMSEDRPQSSARYQPILPDLIGASNLE